MGDTFPELKSNEKKIHDIIRDEEESFENTLAKVILVFKWFCITVNLFGRVFRVFFKC
jgi:alanyl-tRNA synthetase